MVEAMIHGTLCMKNAPPCLACLLGLFNDGIVIVKTYGLPKAGFRRCVDLLTPNADGKSVDVHRLGFLGKQGSLRSIQLRKACSDV